MIRILTLITGLFGAASLSQFPEFSQQYLQRLAGAVDELTRVVADFDASAAGVGLSRDAALESLTGGEFQEARRADMTRTIARSERLSADLAVLRDTPMAMRALQPHRFTDAEIAAAAWADFKPAVPVTVTGAGFAGSGFLIGAILGWPIWRILGWPLRALRRRPAAAQTKRADPPPLTRTVDGAPRVGLPIGWLARTNSDPHKVVLEGQATQICVMAVAPGMTVSGQGSASGEVVLIGVDGTATVTMGGTLRTIGPEQLMIVPPGTGFDVENTGEGLLRLYAVEPRSALGLHAARA